MTTALQTPLRHAGSKAVGPNVFRKQILPLGQITYEGRDMDLDEEYLTALVDSFNGGVFPQVPFQLADSENRHTEDPERFRGEVKGLELTGDGLDAIIELTSAGADLLRQNPKLGVSARILDDVVRADGRRAPLALRHVCGTLDAELAGMNGWEKLSDLSSDYGHVRVVDLTGATYRDEMADTETTTPEFSEEELAKLRALLAKDASPPPGERTSGEPSRAGLPDDLSDDEKAAMAEFVKMMRDDSEGEGDPEDKTEKPEPATAALSAEAQHQIDLAAQQAKQAQRDADDLRKQLAVKDFEAERRDYASAGVPKAAVDLAKPALMHRGTIDLSHDDKVDVGKIARGLLGMMKGTIDLTGEQGSSAQPESAEREEAERLLKAMDEQFGTKTVKSDA